MVRASGKKVIGVIKEKGRAQQELTAAIAAGHTHAHGEEITKDGGHLDRFFNYDTTQLTLLHSVLYLRWKHRPLRDRYC
jgi:hypothetical protein